MKHREQLKCVLPVSVSVYLFLIHGAFLQYFILVIMTLAFLFRNPFKFASYQVSVGKSWTHAGGKMRSVRFVFTIGLREILNNMRERFGFSHLIKNLIFVYPYKLKRFITFTPRGKDGLFDRPGLMISRYTSGHY